MKQYILFDHDGVLVDTELWYFLASQRALAEIDILLEKDLYLQYMAQGIACWELARNKGVDDTLITQQKALRNTYYREYLQTEHIEIDGVEDVLSELSQTYTMAIVTTSKREDFELIHKHRNIVPYMEFVLTVEDYARAKPCPDPYIKGLACLNAATEQALVIEDSARGLQAAVAAGIDCAVVHNTFTETHDFSSATHKIQTLNELPHLLDRLKSSYSS